MLRRKIDRANVHNPRHVSVFQRKYSDAQRDAIAAAVVDDGIRPAKRVVELAAAGKLTWEGEQLKPFNVPEATVRDAARHLRRQRLGKVESEYARLPARDAIEGLRRRLLSSADAMLRAEERRKPENRNADRQRDIARMAREAAAIKPPTDEPSRKPGARDNGARAEGATRSGMAGALLNAHRQGLTAPDVQTTEAHTENGDAAMRSGAGDGATEGDADERPGSVARAADAAVPAAA